MLAAFNWFKLVWAEIGAVIQSDRIAPTRVGCNVITPEMVCARSSYKKKGELPNVKLRMIWFHTLFVNVH